jgi:tRNA pseudouridine-54 N-methylase
MEELLELRAAIEQHRYNDALYIIADMEEMAREDKINKIGSYAVILLLHLVKQHAERRTTRSWHNSMWNALNGIRKTNKRRSAGGFYVHEQEFRDILDESYEEALRRASEETLEGTHTAKQLAAMISAEAIKAEALDYILNGLPESED